MRKFSMLLLFTSMLISLKSVGQNYIEVNCPLIDGELVPKKTLKGVNIPFNGLDIKADEDLNVYSNTNGTISKIAKIVNRKMAVLVQSGEYTYVFSNLEEVYLSVGDKVSEGQSLGLVNDSKDLHFELWQEDNRVPSEDITLFCKN